jgi:hypothetical protein
MEARAHPRAKCRLTVDLYCPERKQQRKCRVSDISLGGMYVVGLPCFRLGQEVHATFGQAEAGALSLICRVARIALDGAGLEFKAASPAQLDQLRSILYPQWRGGDLLQGVLILSHWVDANQFSDWLRLLTLLEHWQKASVSAHRELAKARLPERRVVPAAAKLLG